MKRLLITDLDDTLYSWIGFFIPAFYAMVEEISKTTGISESILLDEYKNIHREKHNVEHPFSTLLLPSIRNMYSKLSDQELRDGPLKEAFHRFNSERKHRLKSFPGVDEMLMLLTNANVKIVGFTDSFEENGYYRLKRLGIEKYFTKVYVYDRQYQPIKRYDTPEKIVHIGRKKPDPEVLLEICRNEGTAPQDTIYMGDSMTKDIYMASCAGIESIWVHRKTDADLYDKLVKISHWTDEDFQDERELKYLVKNKNITPTYTVTELSEVTEIILCE